VANNFSGLLGLTRNFLGRIREEVFMAAPEGDSA